MSVTGRGGLPPSPDEPLSSEVVWSDTRLTSTTVGKKVEPRRTTSISKASDAVEIIPATGWVFNDNGEVTLVSHAPQATLGSTPTTCPKW